jgi:hypothetical protein
MANLIFEEFQGNFIKKDGVCYEFLQTTTSATNAIADGVIEYNDCNECFNSFGLNANDFALNVATLDGSTQYLSTSDNSAFDATTALSLGCWFKVGDNQNSGIISKWGGSVGSRSYLINYNANTVIFNISFDGTNFTGNISQGSLNTAQWYHVVCTFDGSNTRMYLDGVEVASAIASGSLYQSSQEVWIGNYDIGSFQFGGEIVQPFIVKQVLTAPQIDEIYNGGI